VIPPGSALSLARSSCEPTRRKEPVTDLVRANPAKAQVRDGAEKSRQFGLIEAPRAQVRVTGQLGEINTLLVLINVTSRISNRTRADHIEVTGFSGEFADHFEVDPRFQDDIKVIS
jgi:hypothetical protein